MQPDTLAPAHLDLLRSVDPDSIAWHAGRYESAHQYRTLIVAARNPDNGTAPTTTDFYLACWACLEDGAAYGSIPCIAGRARDVWRRLLADHGIATDPPY